MRARSAYISEEIGMLECYGKSYEDGDEDCEDCPLSGDCESLSELRAQQVRIAKRPGMPAVKPRPQREEEQDDEVPWLRRDPEEEPQQDPWAQFHAPPQPQTAPHPQYANPRYMVPIPPTPMQPFMHPGMHSSAQIIPHPAPHLTYMMANPVDCPMPECGEEWYKRVFKNVASGVLSESGRQFYEFFRRFRF